MGLPVRADVIMPSEGEYIPNFVREDLAYANCATGRFSGVDSAADSLRTESEAPFVDLG